MAIIKKFANKVMQIQQWVAEVKALAGGTHTDIVTSLGGDAAAAMTAASDDARYAAMKELIGRKAELEAPLEDSEEAEGKGRGGASEKGVGGGKKGDGKGESEAEEEDQVQIFCEGMEGVYGEAADTLAQLENDAEKAEVEVDTWFDEHRVSEVECRHFY